MCFFKQKTAYEMRISDWSSDVCSSDLLDAVAPTTPVVLVRGGHSMFLNSAALHRFAITRDTPIPAGGQISRDARQQLTGELIDTARDLGKLPPPPALSAADHIRTKYLLNRYGITPVPLPGTQKQD